MSLLLTGCFESAGQKELTQADELFQQEKFAEAESIYERLFRQSSDRRIVLKSAERLTEITIFKTKNYKKAIEYLDVLIANAETFSSSYEALRKKAFIQHKNLFLYEAAVASYQRLLSHPHLPSDEEAELRMNVAKCYFAINEFALAKAELVPLESEKHPRLVQADAYALDASILQAEGITESAVEKYNKALELIDSDEDKKEVLISLALCYEQKEAYDKALEALKRIQKPDVFLSEKTKQLERLAKFQGRRLNR